MAILRGANNTARFGMQSLEEENVNLELVNLLRPEAVLPLGVSGRPDFLGDGELRERQSASLPVREYPWPPIFRNSRNLANGKMVVVDIESEFCRDSIIE